MKDYSRIIRAYSALPVAASMLLSCCASPHSTTAHAPIPSVTRSTAASSGRIEIRFEGIDAAKGNGPIRVALWNDERSFMRDGAWVCAVTVLLEDASKATLLEQLPVGRYAISAFHDTRDGGSLRRGALGIPIDPWAMSNGGGLLEPPSWKRASFDVAAGTTVVLIDFAHQATTHRSMSTAP